MIESLINKNNGIGTPEDFEGLVLNGFSIDDLTYCGITKAEIDQKHSRFLSFIQTPGKLNQNLKSCD